MARSRLSVTSALAITLGVAAAAISFFGAGCGADREGFQPPPDGDAPEAQPVFEAGAPRPDPFCTGPHCSSDLHSYVECTGEVIRTCPDDQGCILEGCAPACEAAKINKYSVGCDYYVIQPDFVFGAGGGCFAAFVANTWNTPAKIEVEYDGAALDVTKFAYVPTGSGSALTYTKLTTDELPAGQVAILFLSQAPSILPGSACPSTVTAALPNDAAFHGTGVGKAFHITSSKPVVAYDIFPYGGGESAITSATLLLPTSAWDTNYLAVDAWGSGGGLEFPVVAVVAAEDGTEISLEPKVAVVGNTSGDGGVPEGGVLGGPAGTTQTYTIDRGQVLQLVQAQSLMGSVIQSNKPVGLWGGKTGLMIQGCCGESAHQQIPPVRALGSEYVGVRYRNRVDGTPEMPPWRLLGAVDGTTLTWEPSVPSGAPVALAKGQLKEFRAEGPFVVRSQDKDHPFYMSAHMTGGESFEGRGDAEFVNVVPAGQFLDNYVFFADPTYPETNLVIVRRRSQSGFADVVSDCAGPLTGWKPVGSSGDYEYTYLDLVRHNFEPQGKCDNGRREIKSKNAFGLTVWGWGSKDTLSFYSEYVSYAYPAGAGAVPINEVVVPVVK